jgi:hypothetical protein
MELIMTHRYEVATLDRHNNEKYYEFPTLDEAYAFYLSVRSNLEFAVTLYDLELQEAITCNEQFFTEEAPK